MEPIIEIISKNIMANNDYNKRLKDEYISTINRLTTFKTNVSQLYRTMDYALLYNTLYDEILYLSKQKKYFNRYLNLDVKEIFNEYIDYKIELYNHYMNEL
jgi:hypothetical protein